MYTELDQLSAAWESLGKQVKDKIFEVAPVEERANKAGVEVCSSSSEVNAVSHDTLCRNRRPTTSILPQ